MWRRLCSAGAMEPGAGMRSTRLPTLPEKLHPIGKGPQLSAGTAARSNEQDPGSPPSGRAADHCSRGCAESDSPRVLERQRPPRSGPGPFLFVTGGNSNEAGPRGERPPPGRFGRCTASGLSRALAWRPPSAPRVVSRGNDGQIAVRGPFGGASRSDRSRRRCRNAVDLALPSGHRSGYLLIDVDWDND
jgi:hypothetical protein